MNTWTITYCSRSFLMCLISLLVVVSTCCAVEPVDPDSSSNDTTALLFDLDFPGGSLLELTDLISEQDPGYKFILKGDAGNSPMPALQVKRVNVDACLWLIDSIGADPHGLGYELWSWHRRVRDGSDLVVIGRVPKKSSRARASVRDDVNSSAVGDEQMIEIYSIAHLLDKGLTARMILLDLENIEHINGQPLGLESAIINDETNLLFIKAKPSIQRLVESLMDALDESAQFIREDDKAVEKASLLNTQSTFAHEWNCLSDVRIESLNMAQLREHIQKLARLRRSYAHSPDYSQMIDSRFELAMHTMHQKIRSKD